MATPRVTEEKLARWVSTVVFVGCAGGLMWALGSTLGVWAALGAGAVVSAIVGGRLWVRHLDNATVEQDRRANASRGGLQVRDEDDEAGVAGRPPGRLRAADDTPSPWARRAVRDADEDDD